MRGLGVKSPLCSPQSICKPVSLWKIFLCKTCVKISMGIVIGTMYLVHTETTYLQWIHLRVLNALRPNLPSLQPGKIPTMPRPTSWRVLSCLVFLQNCFQTNVVFNDHQVIYSCLVFFPPKILSSCYSSTLCVCSRQLVSGGIGDKTGW